MPKWLKLREFSSDEVGMGMSTGQADIVPGTVQMYLGGSKLTSIGNQWWPEQSVISNYLAGSCLAGIFGPNHEEWVRMSTSF
jgi:hypothetical protein